MLLKPMAFSLAKQAAASSTATKHRGSSSSAPLASGSDDDDDDDDECPLLTGQTHTRKATNLRDIKGDSESEQVSRSRRLGDDSDTGAWVAT